MRRLESYGRYEFRDIYPLTRRAPAVVLARAQTVPSQAKSNRNVPPKWPAAEVGEPWLGRSRFCLGEGVAGDVRRQPAAPSFKTRGRRGLCVIHAESLSGGDPGARGVSGP